MAATSNAGVDLHDVRMIQSGKRLCLRMKTEDKVWLPAQFLGQHLERATTLRNRVDTAKYLPHAA